MLSYEVETKYGKINYSEYGDKNKPTIICLHGLAGNGFYSFDELADFLKDHFHLIVMDLPGHGKSSGFPNEEQYLFSNLANWLDDFLKTVSRKSFFIMGHSFGADVALHYTRHFPGHVRGLILLDGGFTFPQNQPEMSFDYAYSGWADYMDKSVFQSKTAVFLEYRNYTQKWDSRKEQSTRSLYQKRKDDQYELIASKFTVLSIIKAFFEEPFLESYPFIKVPTLLIHADLPKKLNASRTKGIQQLTAAIDDVTVSSFSNASHMLQWDCPNQTAAVIAKWIHDKK